ncbi:MAG: hypothetical protein WA125_16945 [Desulfosporosinus sp.]
MRKSLEDIKHMVKAISYPGGIPADIIAHHVYLLDAGHSILCVLTQHWDDATKGDPNGYEVPVPVKYVLEKGYKISGDFIVVDAPYDSDFGLDVPDEYYEYEYGA